MNKRTLYYGTEQPLPEQVPLRAGPLTAVFENGDLRWIRYGEAEVLRRVYAAVRDRNWGTVPAALSNLAIERAERSFRISYDAEHRQGPIHFRWRGRITGSDDGTILFELDGRALSTFLRNRIGYCVLHPIRECAGRPCVVEHSGGEERGLFPLHVSPHQPFQDMRAISHQVAPGVTAEVRFEGEVFEMEDQRNWTDASYKTYCTPLGLPFPVEVPAGAEIRQSVRLSLKGRAPVRERAGSAVVFRIGEERAPLPAIGLCCASHGRPLSETELRRLKAMRLAHLRCDLRMGGEWKPALDRAAAEARALGLPLEMALLLSDNAEQELAALKPAAPVARWLVFHEKEKSTSARWLELARRVLKGPIIGGTNAFFAELNRERPDAASLDGGCFSLNPQVHAFDNDSLTENLAAQSDAVSSARAFLNGKPVYVSPVTLRMRFNPNATGPEPAPEPGQLPGRVDPRQMSLYGAAWTLGSLKYLAQSGAAAVSFYETSGWLGVMDTEAGSPAPFPAVPGGVFPMYHVLTDAGEFAGGQLVRSESSAPLAVDGVVLVREGRMRVLLASFSPEPQTVRLDAGALGRRVSIRRLDETSASRAMNQPEEFRNDADAPLELSGHWLELTLRPYAMVRIDA